MPLYLPKFIGAKAYRTTTLSLSAATWTDVTFDSEAYDTAAIHDTSSNTERMTIPVTGYWHLAGRAHFGSGDLAATGKSLYVALFKNNTTYIRQEHIASNTVTANSSVKWSFMAQDVFYLTAGDYVTMRMFSTDALTVGIASGDERHMTFTATLLGT